MLIRKRDGTVQDFDPGKIGSAIRKAFESVDLEYDPAVVHKVIARVGENMRVEEIQDIIEVALMKQHEKVAKSFILYREKHRLRRLHPDPEAISSYIHAAKYARWTGIRRETYEETVNRVCDMHCQRYPTYAKEIEEAFQFVHAKKVLPSMRSMQFAGDAIRQENARMFNCSFTLADRPRVFSEILYLLLCGCGVGYSLLHIGKLPVWKEPKTIIHYHVSDTIRGWATALEQLISGFQQGIYAEFDYSMIRPAGSPLVTSGGKAPGHLPLKTMLEKVRSLIPIGRRMRSIEVHDIICHIAECVLAGGIRRSSLIALFDPNDEEMFYCKSPENFMPGNPQRAMANNSAMLRRDDRENFLRVMKTSREGYGEPGFFFSHDDSWGCNPCGEIGLFPVHDNETGFAFCNLCEINCSRVEDFAASCEAAAIIGTLQASYTDFGYLTDVSKKIADRDALLGVSLTGMQDNRFWREENVLMKGVDTVRKTNIKWAKRLGIQWAKRLTCVKPSGTASLELGCVGSGIHPHHAKKYFRHITANPREVPARVFKEVNPHMVSVKDNGDWVLKFPVEGSEPISAEQLLDDVFFVYDNWVRPGSDGQGSHNISCTICTDEDFTEVVWRNRCRIAAMSFAPANVDKLYPFAPREKVDENQEAEWADLIENYNSVDWESLQETEETFILTPACEGNRCENVHRIIVLKKD